MKLLGNLLNIFRTKPDLFQLIEAGISPDLAERLLEEKDMEEYLRSLLKEGRISDERVILIVGVNGTGKTTTVAKMARWFMKRGETVSVAASDTFRAGAIEQLEEWEKKIGFRLVKHGYGSDPAAVAYDAVRTGSKRVIIDTSGRQDTRGDLMEQLKKIKRVVNPDLTLMVVDVTQGFQMIEQANRFDVGVGIDGFVLTKVDVDERGGIPFSLAYEINKPFYFYSYGQNVDDFDIFDKKRFLEAVLKHV